MTKVLIVDDFSIVRAGVKHILGQKNFEIGEAATAGEATTMLYAEEWDVALIDISLPGISGIELLRQVKKIRPETKVLMLSMHSAERYAMQVMRNGGSGYLQKEAVAEELLAAVHTVLSGKQYISLEIGQALTETVCDTGMSIHDVLSQRETEIFLMLAAGERVTDIARTLAISIKTISTYRCRILEKMKMKTNADLIYYGVRNGLVK